MSKTKHLLNPSTNPLIVFDLGKLNSLEDQIASSVKHCFFYNKIHESDEMLGLLEKIISACQISDRSKWVAIPLDPSYTYDLNILMAERSLENCIHFGIEPKTLRLNCNHQLNQLINVGNTRLLFSSDLKKLLESSDAKRLLWSPMKKMFKLT